MLISASIARLITDESISNKQNALETINQMIKKAASEGKSSIVFKDSFECNFPSKKEAVKFLTKRGYNVSVKRFTEDDSRSGYFFQGYFYTISW